MPADACWIPGCPLASESGIFSSPGRPGPGRRAARLSGLVSTLDDIPETPLAALWRAGVGSRRYEELVDELTDDGTIVRVGSGDRRSRSTPRGWELGRDRDEDDPGGTRETPAPADSAAGHGRLGLPEILRPALLEAVLTHLVSSGELVTTGSNLGPADAQVQLTKAQRPARDTCSNRSGRRPDAPTF
ncbi:MAG: hypothetical protein Ct9H300mP1_05080 [Planctomycetaceae bacterium]|nr:MAG: hypothetical protein Ct9H300mP1_05080 [Planctomycetaceae bacterium]